MFIYHFFAFNLTDATNLQLLKSAASPLTLPSSSLICLSIVSSLLMNPSSLLECFFISSTFLWFFFPLKFPIIVVSNSLSDNSYPSLVFRITLSIQTVVISFGFFWKPDMLYQVDRSLGFVKLARSVGLCSAFVVVSGTRGFKFL